MRLPFWLMGILFFLGSNLLHGADFKPLSLDLKLNLEGRSFEHHGLALLPGHSIGIIERAKKEDARAYSVEIEAQAINQEQIKYTLSVASIEAGKRETLTSPTVIATLGKAAEISQGEGKSRLAISIVTTELNSLQK